MLPPSSPVQLRGIQREQMIHYYFLEGYTYRLIAIMLFTFSARNANVITTAKESALQAWAKKTSH